MSLVHVYARLLAGNKVYENLYDGKEPKGTVLDEFTERSQLGDANTLYHAKSNPAFESIVRKTMDAWNFCSKAPMILEVGCGMINEDGRSRLTQILPKFFEITHVDQNPSWNPSNHPNFTPSSIHQLSQNLAKTYDIVLASCVFDTIHRDRLSAGIGEIVKCMAPGALLISFSDRPPFNNTLTDFISKHGHILFPYVSTSGLCMLHICPEKLKTYLETTPLEPQVKHFLEWYVSLGFRRREELIVSYFNENAKETEIFGKFIDDLKIPNMGFISSKEFYHKNLYEALTENQLKPIKFKKVSYSAIAPSDPSQKLNHIKNIQGVYYVSMNYVVAPGQTYYEHEVHVMIARRNVTCL